MSKKRRSDLKKRTKRNKKKLIRKLSKHISKKCKDMSKKRGRKCAPVFLKRLMGGKYMGEVTGTNDFQNYYLEKYAGKYFTNDSPIRKYDNISEEIKGNSILWIIDMQNDFIDIPMEGLTGPFKIGAFAVSEGSTMINSLIKFINNNKEKFSRIIFTRDWHPKDHCSFHSESSIGTFPPHCIWNSLGADFNPEIKGIIQKDTDGSGFKCNGIPVDILFKGHHQDTDSFTGVTWKNDNEYPFKNRQLTSCCQYVTCANKTGARKLKPPHYNKSLDKDIGCSDGVDCFEEEYLLPIPGAGGEIYVVGLAGEFCVKDTAIQLKLSLPGTQVNVIQDFTRYVFVPANIPFQRYELININNSKPCEFKPDINMYGEWQNDNGTELSDSVFKPIQLKALSLYMFSYNPFDPSQTKRLEIEELETYKSAKFGFDSENNLLIMKKTPDEVLPALWHFSSDHRILLKDYKQFGVNLLVANKAPLVISLS